MTDEFRVLRENFPKEQGVCMADDDCQQVQTISLYQIADSLNEIDKDLRNIIGELRKRKA